jgi:hypothetical protein
MFAAADAELDLFRRMVNCAVVLERMTDGWRLDARESTKRALKYRRGAGEIIIVNHGGRGWWDATGSAKGDVFNLVQHLEPSLNFGQVRQVLRGFIGAAPSYPAALYDHRRAAPDRTPAERWAARPQLRPGDAAWTYLAGARAIPEICSIPVSAESWPIWRRVSRESGASKLVREDRHLAVGK